MIDSLFDDSRQYQMLYDEQTFYGQLQSQQIIWNKTMVQELKQWEDYSFENMQIKCKEYTW